MNKKKNLKVVLLAASGGEPGLYFPYYSSKPKHLYSYDGQIHLKRVINQLLEVGFEQEDIGIVVGFQYKKIIRFLKKENFKIEVKVNHNWKKSSAWTLKTAMEGVEDDFFLLKADENLKTEFYSYIQNNPGRIWIDSIGVRLLKEYIPLVHKVTEEYLNQTTITNTNLSLSNDINKTSPAQTGVALSYIFYKIRDLIENYNQIEMEYPKKGYWSKDLDDYWQTDEWKNRTAISQYILRFLNLFIKQIFKIKRITRKK